jgi:hypothetical protein
MILTDLTSLASLVSSVAVLVSLLFIGLQLRQSNRNQRSLMQQGRSVMGQTTKADLVFVRR